jgi:predicted  nucleic acid-binding Zn-ribbon protein
LRDDLAQVECLRAAGLPRENIKAALREAVTRRRKVLDLRAQASGNDAGITEIERDQDRIRKNMTALDRNSALYQRYVKELDEQETRIQNHRKEAIRLRNAAATAEQEFTAYLDTMNIG